MQKAERHDLILNVVSSRPISRQDELADVLHKNGFNVTQASVSRDLDELGIVKVDGVYKLVEVGVSGGIDPFGIASIEPAGDNLLVVKCSSGMASAATVRIDAERFEDIVGTIAGDDTIFIAVRDPAHQKSVSKKVRTLFAGK